VGLASQGHPPDCSLALAEHYDFANFANFAFSLFSVSQCLCGQLFFARCCRSTIRKYGIASADSAAAVPNAVAYPNC
jgi:hypothetical protein